MYPTIKDILALSELRECHLLNPGVSCKQVVKSVTVMDNPNILNWLAGYEVLFCNGLNLVNFQNREWKQFFSGLVKLNVAALFFKLSYFVDHLPKEIVEYTVELDFPVVIVPNSYSWITLSDPIQQYIIEQQYYYIKKAVRFRDRLNSIMIQGGSLFDICMAAAADLGKPVAVFDGNWNWIGGTEHSKWEKAIYLLHTHTPRYGEGLLDADLHKYPHYLLEYPEGRVLFIPMPDQLGKRHLALLLPAEASLLQIADTYHIEQLNIVLMLFFYKEIELSRIEKHYYTNFLLDLIDGILTDKKEISEKAARLGRKVHESYYLIIFECGEPASRNLLEDVLGIFKPQRLLRHSGPQPVLPKLEFPIQDIMVCEKDHHIILFFPVIVQEKITSITQVCEIISGHLKRSSMQYGVSRFHDITSIHVAYTEALFALSMQRFVNRQVICYDDLGLLRLFEANSRKADIVFLSEFYKKTIQPLVEYDLENKTQLVDTLEAFLKNEFSTALTAGELYIHENTLRARIKRLEEITGRSLKAPMAIAELVIGLQIYRLSGPQ